ncbi:hypothetical protein Mapa_007578 [Marchantia paleacea]|nr:hypothetical protein Mapa_007578 [Marchantia paleacea]
MSFHMSPASLDTAAVAAMVSVMGRYTLETLLDSDQRAQHKEQCAERLRCYDGRQVQYAEQAVLANLDWGIGALEEAIRTTNDETKVARLDHSEKMLQVCALLDCRATTAGVANSYLSAWAHLNLAFVWKLRSDDRKAATHMLEMFLVDPLFSRVDFAPALWEHLFLPHLTNIVNWYTKQRQSIVLSGNARKMTEEYENSFSMSRDFAAYHNDQQVNVFNLSADQTSQLQALEKLYQDSLDENTRQYARYYKDWLNYDSASANNKSRNKPLMPIAEPPHTPVPDDVVMPTMPMLRQQASKRMATSAAYQRMAPAPVQPPKKIEPVQAAQEFSAPGQMRSGLASMDDPDSPNSNFRKPIREDNLMSLNQNNNVMNITSNIMNQAPEHVQPPQAPSSTTTTLLLPPPPNRRGSLAKTFTMQRSAQPVPAAQHLQLPQPQSKRGGGGHMALAGSGQSTPSSDEFESISGSPKHSEDSAKSLKESSNSYPKSSAAAVSQSPTSQSPRAMATAAKGLMRTLSFKRDQTGPPVTTETPYAPSNNNNILSSSGSKDSTTARALTKSKSGRYYEMGLSLKNSSIGRRFTDVFAKSTDSPRASAAYPIATSGSSNESSDESESLGGRAGAAATGEARIQEHQQQQPPQLQHQQHQQSHINRSVSKVTSVRSLRFQSRYADEEMQTDNSGCLSTSTRGGAAAADGTDDESDVDGPGRRPGSSVKSAERPASLPPIGSPAESSASTVEHHHQDQAGLGLGHMGISHRQSHRRSESLSSSKSDISRATPLTRPPKDFVCPITNQLFNDPVTLETGQTYERKAIQEWLDRGNTTCPITRQTLVISALPKTNYVLKRVVDSWKEQHPELAAEFGSSAESPLMMMMSSGHQQGSTGGLSPIKMRPSRSLTDFGERSPEPLSPGSISSLSSFESSGRPVSRRFSRRTLSINQDRSTPQSPVNIDGLLLDVRPAINRLCSSEDFEECESLALEIARSWQEARADPRLVAALSKAGAADGLMEVLANSSSLEVLRATIYLLSGLVDKDDSTRQVMFRIDPRMTALIGILRKGLTMAVVLLYQLKLPVQQLAPLDLLPLLVLVIKQSDENRAVVVDHDELPLIVRPKSAAIMLLDQIVTSGDPAASVQSAQAILALQAVPALISSLESSNMDERISVVSLLLSCMQSDGRSRHLIVQLCNLTPVVDLLHSGNNRARTVTISFLADLVHLPRRSSCRDVLHAVKKEGLLSSMHVLLVHLQMAPIEQKPVAAGLLLQLDLLEEPRKRSMFREEAVESLVEALNNTEDVISQIEAARTLESLGGRYSCSGRSMMEPWLLRTAGLEKSYQSFVKEEPDCSDQTPEEEEEKVARLWERRVAGALVGHDLGTLIDSLGQGIQCKNPEVSKPSMVVATWLTHLLPVLPDTGIRQTARSFFLDHFVGVLQTSKELPQRALAALAIHSFISDQEGIEELLKYAKDICGPLRQLKKTTWVAKEILRAFNAHASPNLAELWVHGEQNQLDTSANGEVRSLSRAKTRIFSGHSDGTIKVWDARKRFPVPIQEIKEHSKSVTSLAVSVNADRLYSGSLDKTIRVWALGVDEIRSVHVFDLKDAIMGLVVNGPMACIIPQGAGIKVQYEETATKVLNQYKHVQSLAISGGKIYCGCTDNSIQEIDPISGSIEVIQHGVGTLLRKKAIYAVHVSKDHLFTAGAPVDGVAGKIWKLSDYSLVGTLSTTAEIRSMAISEDFIYLGSNTGIIEVWLRDRLVKVTTMNVGSKVLALMLDGDTLYSGSEDGKIRAWTMV